MNNSARPAPSPWMRELARLCVIAKMPCAAKGPPAIETPEGPMEVRRALVERPPRA
jgi:hypothetical protein